MIICADPVKEMTEKQQRAYDWACGKLKKLILNGFSGEFAIYFLTGGIRNTKTTHHEAPKF
jgi:uncharacterized protein YoaH (UPF0181 family)